MIPNIASTIRLRRMSIQIDSIENAIARECLRLVPVAPPLYIGTVADLPASSGLGSSSCFCSCLAQALHLMRGGVFQIFNLLRKHCHIEINVLGRPVGKQDHYASTFGGLNVFQFWASGRVTHDPLMLNLHQITNFSLIFCYFDGT